MMTDRQRQQPEPPANRRTEERTEGHTERTGGERTGGRPRHEGDEPIAQRGADAPRSVGKQGHRDLERGVEDTDLRGGGDYQQRTQNDGHANRNSQRREKPSGDA